MMDCQEFGRRSSWILQGNINCHLEYCKILPVNSLRFPDTISRRQRVLPPQKVLAFMLLLHIQKNAYDTNFQVLLCTYNVLDYFKTDTSKNAIYSQQTLQSAQQLSFCFTLFLCMFRPLHMAVHIQFVLGILMKLYVNTRVGTLIVATIYLQRIQNRCMFRSFTVLRCSHQHCVQPAASDVEVVGYL